MERVHPCERHGQILICGAVQAWEGISDRDWRVPVGMCPQGPWRMKTGDAVSGLLLMMETGSGSPDEDFLLPSGRKKDQTGAIMAEKPC